MVLLRGNLILKIIGFAFFMVEGAITIRCRLFIFGRYGLVNGNVALILLLGLISQLVHSL